MQNYFNYFTEVEEYFQQKRGTWMLLSTLDWALIDTWREAGIPLEVIFRGIDASFEKWEKRPSKTRRINSLAYCLQEVLAAFEEQKEANVGRESLKDKAKSQALFSFEELKSFFDSIHASVLTVIEELRRQNVSRKSESADETQETKVPRVDKPSALAEDFERLIKSLQSLEQETLAIPNPKDLDFEQLERRLSSIEEKLLAAIKNSVDDRTLVKLESEADRALAPYKRNMRAEMISNLQRQFIHKRLLELWSLPRISLFHLQ